MQYFTFDRLHGLISWKIELHFIPVVKSRKNLVRHACNTNGEEKE
jgi:hypothetical protein